VRLWVGGWGVNGGGSGAFNLLDNCPFLCGLEAAGALHCSCDCCCRCEGMEESSLEPVTVPGGLATETANGHNIHSRIRTWLVRHK